MPGRQHKTTVTYQQVASAANKFLLAGQNPTIDRIYELYQNISTRKDVANHLRRWRTDNKQKIQTANQTKNMTAQSGKENTAHQMEELQETLSLVRSTLESTADGILVLDLEGKLVDWNQKFVDIAGFTQEVIEQGDENAGIQFLLSQLEQPEELISLILHLREHPEEKGDMGIAYFKDGRIFERYSQPHIVSNEIIGRVWSFREITEKIKSEEALRLRDRAIEASTHGIIITHSHNGQEIIYANPAFEKITGYRNKEIIGKNYYFLQGNDQDQAELQSLRLAQKELRDQKAVLRSYRKDGTMFWNEMYISPVPDPDGNVSHFVGIINDITERKAMEAQLIHQATHDALTDLPNRVLLQDRINQAILYTKRANAMATVLFLDLDHFKLINDTLGHKMGDELLCAVAKRVKDCMRETDTVARIGGDEFIITLSPMKKLEESMMITEKILEKIREPFQIEERELNITASIGVSCYPRDGLDSETLIKNADTAMYQAKDVGRDNFQFFTDEMNVRVSQRLAIQNSLHHAIARNEFHLAYQPVIKLATGEITGVEALLRWNNPELGPISPLEFIPLAEETGLIVSIGEWVLKTACTQNVAWQQLGLPKITISVNVSGRQFQNTDFIGVVRNALTTTGLDPQNLNLELTESMLMDNCEETLEILKELKKMGVSLAIDDFGTGYSSLSYLHKLPVDTIKIDKTFVHDISNRPDEAAITLAIIAMSKSLNLKVIAEGTQTRQDMDFLRIYQCDEVQGYYFSRPLDADACTLLLRENFGLLGG